MNIYSYISFTSLKTKDKTGPLSAMNFESIDINLYASHYDLISFKSTGNITNKKEPQSWCWDTALGFFAVG